MPVSSLTPEELRQVSNLVRSIVTPHDMIQDAMALFAFLVVIINSMFLGLHLLAHRQWRERENGDAKMLGPSWFERR